MKIIINSSSMVPIYEQIMDQIKSLITGGDLKQMMLFLQSELLQKS